MANTEDRLLTVARRTIRRVRFCVAAGVARTGEVNARVVQPLSLGADWSVSFVTAAWSRKAEEIQRTGRLTLVYQHDREGAYVTLVGRAWIDSDPAARRAVWVADLDQWFPGGSDHPDAVLVRFAADRIELWNHARDVAPEPRGLKAAIVERDGDGWRCVES